MTMRRDTKTIIVKAALRLFAKRGYDGTGMRDIAEMVGIQPPSLYKHFSGKQAIFDGVVSYMNARYEQQVLHIRLPQGNTTAAAQHYAELSDQHMALLAEALFRYWTEDDEAVLFRQMLTMEQCRRPEVGVLYRSLFIDGRLTYQAELFAEMIDASLFVPGDPRLFALAFYAPLLLLMQASDRCDSRRAHDEIISQVCQHVAQFVISHGPPAIR